MPKPQAFTNEARSSSLKTIKRRKERDRVISRDQQAKDDDRWLAKLLRR